LAAASKGRTQDRKPIPSSAPISLAKRGPSTQGH
jgi:hypothetical protein